MSSFSPGSTVFVIDDDLGSCNAIASTVRIMGVSTKIFTTAEEFLEGFDQQQPGCVVADLRLPGMSGLMLLRRLRSEAKKIPLILVSGFVDVELAVEALHCGALTVLEKPYRSQMLWDSIVQGLNQDHEHHAAAALMERVGALNDEEARILEMMVCDIPNRVIARQLQISRRTVDYRRSQILTKLQAGNLKSLIWRLGAAGWPIAAERGLKLGTL